MKIALVGATGLVGCVMRQVLEERGFAQHEVLLAASPRSVGKSIPFAGGQQTVISVEEAIAAHPQYAIFSAGAAVSREYAPRFAEVGCTVIDNSSCWRMDDKVPLVVPEINLDAITPSTRIIANPNCSTIQMVLALSRLHWRYHIRRIVVSTYQSVTGTGQKAVQQLEAEEAESLALHTPLSTPHSPHSTPDAPLPKAYPHPIHRNLFPHGGDFLPNGYTTEEQKLVNETRKIFGDPTIQVSPTVVRVPVVGGHSEAVNVEFAEDYDLSEARQLIADTPGVVVLDDPSQNLYPTPMQAHHRDEVLVGRIRRDDTQPRTLNLWVVADNLRKGAATNAIQIMQALLK